MSSRRFFRCLLFTFWIPIVGGMAASVWFSRQEPVGAGYECLAKLTREEWRKSPEIPSFLDDRHPIRAVIGLLESAPMDTTVRERLAPVFGLKVRGEARVKGIAFPDGVIGIRVTGNDPAFIQAYLNELLAHYSAWLKQMADAEDFQSGEWKDPITILKGPSAPTPVTMPMDEAIVQGSLIGGGGGLLLVILISLIASLGTPSRRGVA